MVLFSFSVLVLVLSYLGISYFSFSVFLYAIFIHYIFRKTGPVQAFPHVEVGSPPSAQDLHTGHARPSSEYSHFMPHSSYNSPSRLGQQPVQRFNQGRSTNVRGYEWNAVRIQPPLPSYNSGGPRSPGSGMSWGKYAFKTVFGYIAFYILPFFLTESNLVWNVLYRL